MTRKILTAADFRSDVTVEGEANFLGQTYFLGSVTEASTLLVDGAAEFDGTVLLHQDPTLPLQAVTKQYVDAHAGSEVEISASDPIAASPAAELWYDTDDPSGGVITPAFDGTPSAVGVTSTPGTLNNWARGDHTHAASAYTSYNGPPSAVALATAAPGSSTSWARGDHVHSIQPGLTGRNLFDNGQMVIKQRAATSTALSASVVITADRWNVVNNGIGAASLVYATNTAGITTGRPRPANIQYISMTTGEAAAALSPGDLMYWFQNIEGQYLQHLNWGYADAQSVTVSFDIYSSVAATLVLELYRGESTPRHFPKVFSVPSGWSTQTLTFPGDTVTPITNDSTARLAVVIWVGSGSTNASGTQQVSWGNFVAANRAAGIGNQVAVTAGNIIIPTNLQFEVGTSATPYEVRRYDDELRSCQRYFRRWDSSQGGAFTRFGAGVCSGSTGAFVLIALNPPFRAAPGSIVTSAPSTFILALGTNYTLTSLTIDPAGSSPHGLEITPGVAAGPVAGQCAQLCSNNTLTAYIEATAEI